jgi:hypothetical protein
VAGGPGQRRCGMRDERRTLGPAGKGSPHLRSRSGPRREPPDRVTSTLPEPSKHRDARTQTLSHREFRPAGPARARLGARRRPRRRASARQGRGSGRPSRAGVGSASAGWWPACGRTASSRAAGPGVGVVRRPLRRGLDHSLRSPRSARACGVADLWSPLVTVPGELPRAGLEASQWTNCSSRGTDTLVRDPCSTARPVEHQPQDGISH